MSTPVEKWVVVDATPADFEALADLMAESPLWQRYGGARLSALHTLRVALLEGDVLLVCRPAPDVPPVGLAWLIRTRILNFGAYLRLLLVGESYLGRGLGERLLRAAEARLSDGSNHLYLLVTRDNSGARRFYERHGYRHVGDLPELVLPGIDEALYHKALRSHAERVNC